MSRARAVVFAYHDVGVRCLKVLLSGGVEVPLVVTVADDPQERRWFASVAATAADYGLPCITPADVNDGTVLRELQRLRPEFIFSFYYRALLGAPLLACASRGALNMHGSLLPRFRGRAPTNWAILKGAAESGATLHYMVARADAGDIVDQQAVPILADDEAREVFNKVTVAAEIVLARSLPALIEGRAPRRAQPILPGEYFGRRTPEDGRIDWQRPAREVHDLVRAVAPPFPGAFTELEGVRWDIHRTRLGGPVPPPGAGPRLFAQGEQLFAVAGDGAVLQLLRVQRAGTPLDLAATARALGTRSLALC